MNQPGLIPDFVIGNHVKRACLIFTMAWRTVFVNQRSYIFGPGNGFLLRMVTGNYEYNNKQGKYPMQILTFAANFKQVNINKKKISVI